MTSPGDRVTPVLLTLDEEPNLERTLSALAWADRVVVLDSGSTDATESIARSFANVAWYVRPFDRHLDQWAHAIGRTAIASEYVLALDADMEVTPAFVAELSDRFLTGRFDGAVTRFEYRYHGRPLRGSIYPDQLRLFRPGEVRIEQPGHTQVFTIEGTTHRFRALIAHDDRKPLERWLRAQASYSALEAERLAAGEGLRWQDRLRRLGLMAPVAGVLAYLRAGGPAGGAAAVRYALERTTYECLLAIRQMNRRLGTRP